MFPTSEYELLDFGRGRKLERFGPLLLDRPSPAAQEVLPQRPELWQSADTRYERTTGEQGVWQPEDCFPAEWVIAHNGLRFSLKPTEFGHVGLFPEQQANWDWLVQQIRAASKPLKVLNLFAYTGGSTLAAASAGAEVVHVDAARNVVDWARQNAALSGLQAAPIRWIVEDALKFVRREVRRGNRYDAVILDPPSYGHGPQGELWKIEEQLPELLSLCGELVSSQPAFLLATCHSPGLTPNLLTSELRVRAAAGWAKSDLQEAAGPLTIPSSQGRSLASGIVVRLSVGK